MKEQIHNLSRKMKILKKNLNGILANRNTVNRKNVFDGLISGVAQERISECDNNTIEISKTGK